MLLELKMMKIKKEIAKQMSKKCDKNENGKIYAKMREKF